MKLHLRTDAFKVFHEDDKVMQRIKKDHNLPDKNWKSTAIRIALKHYAELHDIPASNQLLADAIKANTASTEEMYFLIQQRLS